MTREILDKEAIAGSGAELAETLETIRDFKGFVLESTARTTFRDELAAEEYPYPEDAEAVEVPEELIEGPDAIDRINQGGGTY